MKKFNVVLIGIFISLSLSISAQQSIYSLASGEEMVYGKIGLFENGATKYTFVVVRKPHAGKEIYKREHVAPYGSPKGVSRGGSMRIDNNPKEYDFYDYWVVFNGTKFGPYDRIYEMHQEDGNVDNWVSADGKSITFTGVRGQRYYPVIANKTSAPFWSVDQAPDCSPVSGKSDFILQWDRNDYRLMVNGATKLRGWKMLKGLEYSKNGDIVYQGKEPNSNDYYVYLNHKKFAGPYNLVSEAIFIPNTNILCVDGAIRESVNGRAVYKHGNILVGDNKIPIPDDHSVGKFNFAGDWVSFYVSRSNKSDNIYQKKTIWIYEFNYKTRQLLKHEGFSHHASIFNIDKNSLYYTTYNQNGDEMLVRQGGAVLQTVSKSSFKDKSVSFKVSPNGDYISWYSNGYSKPYTLMLNEKPFTAAGNKIMGIEEVTFCPAKHTIRLIVNKDKSVGSRSRKYVIGDNVFDLDGNFGERNRVFTSQSNDIFHVQSFTSDDSDWRYEIYKNDKKLTEIKWSSVNEITASPNGNRYAALVTDLHNVRLFYYFCLNPDMHIKRKLLVDGNIVNGNYGAPVWSKRQGKFLVLQEKNRKVTLTEL